MKNNNSSDEILRASVRQRVHNMSQFYTHLFIFCIGWIIFISKTYFGVPLNFFPIRYINSTFMWVWTFIIVVQGVKLFISETILGSKWEQNEINKIIEKEKLSNNKWN